MVRFRLATGWSGRGMAAVLGLASVGAPAGAGEVTVRGRVLDPAGAPVAGAIVRTIASSRDDYPPIVATTGPDGRFALPDSARFASTNDNVGDPLVIASAAGFGPGWAAHDPKQPEATVRLVPPGPALEGRLVDGGGRPVVGATVEVVELRFPSDKAGQEGTLDRLLARPADDPFSLSHFGRTIRFGGPAATTDADGRFALPGFGAERVAALVARSPTTATTRIFVATRAALAGPVARHDAGILYPVQPPRFELALPPGRAIIGTITAADTGRPLAGWRVVGAHAPAPESRYDEDATTTDAAGRYTLTGLGLDAAGWVLFEPPAGQPYLAAGFHPPAAAPEDGPAVPRRLDLAARRGIVVRGRVTGKSTGKPLLGELVAGSMRTNPQLKDFPGHADSRLTRVFTDDEGLYEVVLPPGPAVVAFRTRDPGGNFIGGQGTEAIPGKLNRGFTRYDVDYFPTVGEPIYVQYTILAGVNPPAASGGETLNLAVESYRTVTLSVTGPDGRPVGGRLHDREPDSMMTSSFVVGRPPLVQYLAPGATRRVTVVTDDRKLGRSILVEADGPAVLPVRLVPCGAVRGRIVADDGTPRADLQVADDHWDRFAPPPIKPAGQITWENYGLGRPLKPGEFVVDGLVPGLHYRLRAAALQQVRAIGTLVDDVMVEPGAVKDLGDLPVRPLPAQPGPARPYSRAESSR